MVRCPLCNKELGRITHTHLQYGHKMYYSKFIRQFPNANLGLIPWNKGKTKETHPSLLRLSEALKSKEEWNFSKWQKKTQRRLRIQYKTLGKGSDLAELTGIVLGAGSLEKFPRTERLRIVCNSNESGYILHIANLIGKKFKKTPKITYRKNENAADISMYQCQIARRLGLPTGDKIKNNVGAPSWIKTNQGLSISCLKGLFETDGCFVVDKPNYTRVMEFKNNCRRLRENVYSMLSKLDYHPQFGGNYVRLARKEEVFKFKNLINFRNH